METIKKWILAQSLSFYVAVIAILTIVILLFILNRNSHKQQENLIATAVLQIENSHLTDINASLQKERKASQKTIDSLNSLNKQKDKEIIQLDKKMAVIASNYAKELSRVKALPNDEAAGMFLDNADCGELPIIKYDSSYLVPICPIRSYNAMKVGYDMLESDNSVLQKKVILQNSKITNLELIVGEKDRQITKLDSINSNHQAIENNLKKQISSEKDNYKLQKRRTFIAWGVAAVEGVLLILQAVK